MPRINCCIPGCIATDVSLHRFPNPKNNLQMFNTWLDVVNLDSLRNMDPEAVYDNRRICFGHFETKYKSTRSSRLHKYAIPSIGLPGNRFSGSEVTSSTPGISKDDIDPVVSDTKPSECDDNIADAIPAKKFRLVPASESSWIPAKDVTLQSIETVSEPQAVVTPRNSDEDSTPVKRRRQCEADCTDVVSTPVKRRKQAKAEYTDDDVRLLLSVKVNRQNQLTPKAKKLYRIANYLKRQKNRVTKKCLSFKQKLKAAENLTQQDHFNKISDGLTPIARKFLMFQLRETCRKPRGRRFTTDEKALSLLLFKKSPKGYDLLKKLFTLPSRKTLNKFLSNLKLRPGINDKLLSNLKASVEKLQPHHRLCSVTFDEMKIATSLEYSEKLDSIDGFVNNGTSKSLKFADHVLVIMARGVVKKWKQPICFTFCEGTTPADQLQILIKNVIVELQKIGLKVICSVCDQGRTNMKAISNLVETTKNEYGRRNEEMRGEFFEINNEKIVPLFDPPHLLKCVRNNLIKYNLKFQIDGKTMLANWDHLVEIYEEDITEEIADLRDVPKLTEAHIRPNNKQKMKVKYCAQVFSQRVAATLRSKSKRSPNKANFTDTARLFLFMDQLFDSVNGERYCVHAGKALRAPLKLGSAHHEFWQQAVQVLESMVFIDRSDPSKTTRPDCLKNWVRTIRGFQLIWNSLREDRSVKFLLLRNFNQDPLENFFGAIRSHGLRNTNPTCTAFIAAYKTLIINNFMSRQSVGANCEMDVSAGALSTLKDLLVLTNDEEVGNLQDLDVPQAILNETINSLLKSNYCCGFILKNVKKYVYQKCADCKNDLEAVKTGMQHDLIKEREYFSDVNLLYYPSFSAVTCFIHIKKITFYILENYALMEDIGKSIKLLCKKNVDFSFISCSNHKEVIINNIINSTVMLIIYGYIKEVNRILDGKKILKKNSLISDSVKKLAQNKYVKTLKNKNFNK